jgi:hypothetical protein
MKNVLKLVLVLMAASLLHACSKEGDLASDNGQGGSMARFVVVGDFMYVVDNLKLSVYNVAIPSQPSLVHAQNVNFGIETLYPYANYLLIGSTTGMYIYEVGSNGIPVFISEFVHVESCDPVVTDGEYAYVTLRSSSICGNFLIGGANRMEVLNISNPRFPYLVNAINLPEPKGLALDDSLLFVCVANQGIAVFNKSNPSNPVQFNSIAGFTANDVIARNNHLLAVCPDGLRQFDYNDPMNISLISYFPVNF